MTETGTPTLSDIDATARRLLDGWDATGRHAGSSGFETLLDPGREWLTRLIPAGLGVPAWPAWCGGRDASRSEVRAIRQTLAKFSPPDLYPFAIGLGIVGPTLLSYATPEQQQRWLPEIARGATIFCQMFSEPDAGSDLANVSTIASTTGDGWLLRGQKVWTSRGAYADWALCLARTDPDAPKHNGLTTFILATSSPGVEIRPLREMTGDAHFSEVFLDDVLVPDANRIGGIGAGWEIATAALAHERASIAGYGGGSRRRASGLPDWLDALKQQGALLDPVVRQRAMRAYILERIQRIAMRGPAAGSQQHSGGSGGKLRQVAAFKERASILKDAAGARGLLADDPTTHVFLTAPSMSIRGGTDEIQRNVIAERALGLPREARVDRDLPWVQSRRGVV